MGTFHSFISQPLSKEEADILYKDVCEVLDNSSYMNSSENCKIEKIRGFYVVVCIIKNLGNIPVELMNLKTEYDWVSVSNENDFYSNNGYSNSVPEDIG